MRLILAGCDYTGQSSLARAIAGWLIENLSAPVVRIHDHWVHPFLADQDPTTCYLVGPDGLIQEAWRYGDVGSVDDQPGLTESWAADFAALKPWLLEQHQRALIWRHMHPTMTSDPAGGSDSIQVGLHYAEAVYAPLYYGYGEPGSFADRTRRAREWDQSLLQIMPDVVLVLLRATPEVIRQRMAADPRPGRVLMDDDVERVVDLFEQQYADSELTNKLAIDTSHLTVEQSLDEFVRRVEPFLSPEDRQRMA
jgi:hypothetical protein